MHRRVALSLTILALLVFSAPLFADTVVEIGDDGPPAGDPQGPLISTFWHDRRSECIYLEEDIGRTGTINSIGLFATEEPGRALNNWTIRLRTTELDNYSSGDTFTPAEDWTVCYTEDSVPTDAWSVNQWLEGDEQWGTNNWTTFVLETPYFYGGSGNLMVDFSFNNSHYVRGGNVRTTPQGGVLYRMYFEADSDPRYPDPLQWEHEGTQTSYNPDIQIGFSDDATVPAPPAVVLVPLALGAAAFVRRRRDG